MNKLKLLLLQFKVKFIKKFIFLTLYIKKSLRNKHSNFLTSKTGFAAIITSPQEKGVAKNIECLDWEEQPMIGKWECIKFIIKKN